MINIVFFYLQSFFIVESIWKTDSVALSIVKNGAGFTGTVDYELFKQISSCQEIEYDIFINETKITITTTNGVKEFRYLLINDEFLWTKGYQDKRTYGKVKLGKSKTLHFDILVKSVEMISNLKKDLIQKCKELEEKSRNKPS